MNHQPQQPHGTSPLLVCDLFALADDERTAHGTLAEALFTREVQETREQPDGYAFCFSSEAFPRIVSFVAGERRCCPFLAFQIDVAPHHSAVWLRLTGDASVKEFLKQQFNLAPSYGLEQGDAPE